NMSSSDIDIDFRLPTAVIVVMVLMGVGMLVFVGVFVWSLYHHIQTMRRASAYSPLPAVVCSACGQQTTHSQQSVQAQSVVCFVHGTDLPCAQHDIRLSDLEAQGPNHVPPPYDKLA
ncbi:hypothetical protein FRC12_016976, partial [Ceratobasidium sp. 428]